MKVAIVFDQKARRDLVLIYDYYARKAKLATADRFLAAARQTFSKLEIAPGMGASLKIELIEPDELRYIPLPSKFKKYLVFYRWVEGRVEVARI